MCIMFSVWLTPGKLQYYLQLEGEVIPQKVVLK